MRKISGVHTCRREDNKAGLRQGEKLGYNVISTNAYSEPRGSLED